MLPWLRTITPAWVGLDINPDEIRLLQLKYHRQAWQVTQYAVAPLPPDTLIDGKIHQPEVVRTLLRQLVQTTKTAGSPTAIALPAHTVMSQQIKLAASLSEAECEAEIGANLKRYVTNVPEALCFDFVTTAIVAGQYRDIHLVAARLQQLSCYAKVVAASGLRVKVVDVDAYALMRGAQLSLNPAAANAVIAVLDVGGAITRFMVFQQQHIIFSQHWENTDLSLLPDMLKRALQVCLTAQKHLRIEHVLLSGKITPPTSFLPQYLLEEFTLTAQFANPFQRMSLAGVNAEELQTLAARFQVCCSLAMRHRHARN